MKTRTFYNYVRKEVKALRLYDPQRAKDMLPKLFADIHPSDSDTCIYGYLYSGCYTLEASRAISACAPGFINSKYFVNSKRLIESISLHKPLDMYNDRDSGKSNTTTFLESYITIKNANIKGVLDYLKGETDSLKLDIK